MATPFRLRPLLLALGCTFALSGAGTAFADTPGAKSEPAPASRPRPPLSSAQLLLQMMLSEIAYARGDVDGALAGYVDLSRRSDDPRIARRANEIATTSILLNASGNPAEAEAAIKAALTRQEAMRGTLLLQLPALFGRSQDKAAVAQTIERLTAPYLSLPEAQLARAQAALDAGQNSTAYTASSEALRLKPDSERAALLLAQSAPPERRKESMEALGVFGQRHPQALDARLNYARWLAMEKHTREASAQYQKLLGEYPENDQLAFAIVGIAAQAGDMATAEDLLKRLIQNGWGDVERIRLLLGEVQEERGRHAEALQSYDSVRLGAQFVTAQIRKARLLAAQGKTDIALQSLRDAAARSSELTPLQAAEAQLLRQNGQLEAAHKVLLGILAREPDNLEALYDAALVAEQLSQTALMEQRLRRVIELKPDHAHALNALGYSFADRNQRLDEADGLLARAIELAPDDAAILDSVGWLRFRQGKQDEALSVLQRAYTLFPDAEVAGHLIEVLWVSGQQNAARKLMADALKASPSSIPLKALAARLGL
ncbi:tetratricopeptide repeat protein [Uliginosibacterium sp. 31-16]|uniref:tetratricopeptide repeat protein n=1 Tax=Uliginosibacterium sp. 31-16 TaxID=3068315 RepID=UPI00274012CA|nr:tetratricopeptide repeat protein [Uliginosibacterium sp. 31-16]MDP5241153.1 tetratricopeptide repeat protein [Uliginosibacterium sp. 31-16]